MRTTIEITEDQRAELLKIAAMRGEKGFSSVVREALEEFLKAHRDKAAAVRTALAMKGVLSSKDADALAERVRETRRSWR